MKLFFLLQFTLFYFVVLSQNYIEYNKKIIEAQLKILENDLDSAISIYNSAIKDVSKSFPKDLLNLANIYYFSDSIEISKKIIKKSISNGAYLKFVKKRFKRKITSKKFWKECNSIYDSVLSEQKKDTLYTFLLKLIQNDQKARKTGFNKRKKMVFTDSVNYISLNKILSGNCYPGYHTIGTYKSLDIISVLLLHIKLPQYESIIQNGLEKGELTPNMAAIIYVRQYHFLNPETCPLFPYFIKDTYAKYTGVRYKKALKMGYNFSNFL